MNEDDLGKISMRELCASGTETGLPDAAADEIQERVEAYTQGKPGVSPLLSRRVVWEMRGLLKEQEEQTAFGRLVFNRGVEAAARWLLARSPEDPSPLEDES